MKNIHRPFSIFLFVLFALWFFGHTSAFAKKTYSVEVEAGLGHDDNVFRSSDTSYLDPFAPKTPGGTIGTTNPKVQSGLFIPYKLKAEHAKKLRKKPLFRKMKLNRWFSRFKLSGRKYLDSDHENADGYKISFDTALEFRLKKVGRRLNTLYIGPIFEQKKKTYYDRDDGTEKLTKRTGGGVLIGDRYSYRFYGLEAGLEVRTMPVQFGFTAQTAKYNYEDVPVFQQFDHSYYRVGGQASYKILPPTKLTVKYDYSVRGFDEWIARNLNGSKKTTLGNPTREYTFHEFGLSLRNRLSSLWVVHLDYNYQTRTDEFVGYSDYNRNTYKIRASYHDKQKRRLKASLTYWTRKHPNTFAFDRATVNGQPSPKTDYDAIEIKLSGEMPLYREWVFWGKIESIQQDTTDPRYEYDRNQIIAGAKIEF